jgi:hypothetical protein
LDLSIFEDKVCTSSKTARTTCPVTQHRILEDPRVHIGVCMDAEVRITFCISHALQFCRTADGHVLITWKYTWD